jgi:hypothetical protein
LSGVPRRFLLTEVIVDRDNNNAPGQNAADENLVPAWAKAEKTDCEVEKQEADMFRSNEEPQRGLQPLRIDLMEDRFEYLNGKTLVKDEKTVQRYRHSLMKADANQMLTGLAGVYSEDRKQTGKWLYL